MGKDVSSLELVNEVQYDLILIAHANKKIVSMIMIDLQKMGVPKDKIIWFPASYI